MKGMKYLVEQIVARLTETEKFQAEGLTIVQVCKRLQISDQTRQGVRPAATIWTIGFAPDRPSAILSEMSRRSESRRLSKELDEIMGVRFLSPFFSERIRLTRC